MVLLKVGDTIPDDCTQVGNIPLQALTESGGILTLNPTPNPEMSSGFPLLASEKTDYEFDINSTGGMQVCEDLGSFCIAGFPLMMALNKTTVAPTTFCIAIAYESKLYGVINETINCEIHTDIQYYLLTEGVPFTNDTAVPGAGSASGFTAHFEYDPSRSPGVQFRTTATGVLLGNSGPGISDPLTYTSYDSGWTNLPGWGSASILDIHGAAREPDSGLSCSPSGGTYGQLNLIITYHYSEFGTECE